MRKVSTCGIALLVLGTLAATGVLAADYYVAPDGADANPGSLEKPMKNPIVAAKKLQPGDTLYFRAGTYPCRTDRVIGLAPSRNGKQDAPISFKNYNNEHVILNVAGSDWGLSNNGYSWIVFDGFEVTGGVTHCMKFAMNHPGSKFSGHHITVRNCELQEAGDSANIFAFKTANLTIENCLFHNGKRSHGLYFNQSCHNAVIRNCTSENNHGNSGMQLNAGGGTITNALVEACILNNNAQGFSLINVHDSTFRNNLVYNDGYKGPRDSGWREVILNNCSGNVFENNTFVNTLPPNHTIMRIIRGMASSKNNTFRNNIFVVKRKPVFCLEGYSGYAFENNCLFNIGGGQQVEKRGDLAAFAKAQGLKESGTLTADPLFVDIDAANFQLKEGSPCIDAGAQTEGGVKVVGKARDIGAYEFGGDVALGCRLPWKVKP